MNAVPAVAVDGALTEKCVAAAEPTKIDPLVPVIALVTVSVAVTVCPPEVLRVTAFANMWMPLSAGVKV